jgi:multidrug efflux pump subunit AcrB
MRRGTPLPSPGIYRRIGRRLGDGFERGFRAVLRGYAGSLDWVLHHRILMNLVTLGTVIFTVWLYTVVPKSFLPSEDTGLLMGQTIANPDISFKAMEKLQRRVVAVLLKDPAIAEVGSRIGVASGFSSLNRGTLFISLKPMNERHVSDQVVITRLRKPLARIVGIQSYLIPQEDLRTGAALVSNAGNQAEDDPAAYRHFQRSGQGGTGSLCRRRPRGGVPDECADERDR